MFFVCHIFYTSIAALNFSSSQGQYRMSLLSAKDFLFLALSVGHNKNESPGPIERWPVGYYLYTSHEDIRPAVSILPFVALHILDKICM
jgi:hypothetical protein